MSRPPPGTSRPQDWNTRAPPVRVPQHAAALVGEARGSLATLPTIKAASSSQQAPQGMAPTAVPTSSACRHTSPPDSVTERDTFTRRRSMSKSLDSQRGHLTPPQAGVGQESDDLTLCRSTASASAATWRVARDSHDRRDAAWAAERRRMGCGGCGCPRPLRRVPAAAGRMRSRSSARQPRLRPSWTPTPVYLRSSTSTTATSAQRVFTRLFHTPYVSPPFWGRCGPETPTTRSGPPRRSSGPPWLPR